MNKTKEKPSTGEGWSIHVYDSDRHLRFILEPSHIWAFTGGIGFGLLVAILWSALASHSSLNNTKYVANLLLTPDTISREDFQTESPSSFIQLLNQ